jgi:hypothetical protein
MVYYVGRIVTIFLGAVLAPIIIMLWLLPSFRDFSESAAKTYALTIFVLFVHVVILQLAASLFAGLVVNGSIQSLNPLMTMIVGVSTLVALLKTQGVMMQMTYAGVGPKALRNMGGHLVHGISSIRDRIAYV